MLRHSFDFVPVIRTSGWSIDDDGNPRLWWRARLTGGPVLLSDGIDASELEADVKLILGTETPAGKTLFTGVSPPVPVWGRVAFTRDRGELSVVLAVSSKTLDRIMRSMHIACPTITVGFSPLPGYGADARTELTQAITQSDGVGYRWDDSKSPAVPVESCEFSFWQPPLESEAPETPGNMGRVVSGLGIAWTVVVNLLAFVIAFAVLNVASTRFESAVVSLLLLVYIGISNAMKALGRALMQLDLSALARFLQLRAVLGIPTSPEETKYVEYSRGKVNSLRPKDWIDAAGSGLIGFLVLYRLAALAMS
jgi:hypothetical protein